MYPNRPQTSSTVSWIIRRGTELMAAATHRLVKTRLGYPAYALSAVDDNANSLCFPHLGIDQGVTGDIRVITAVLPDGAAHTVRGQMDVLHRQCQLHALGCQQADGLLLLPLSSIHAAALAAAAAQEPVV